MWEHPPLLRRTAVVTGAGAGLGRAIAIELAWAGADVAILDVDDAAATEAVAIVASAGVVVRRYRVDVSESREVDDAIDQVHRDFSRLDILVNNAGISRVGPHIPETTDDAWDRSIGVMQSGVFYGMRAASRFMLPQRSGSIINISSIRGFSPNPGRIAYCAAKAAVLMMSRVAAAEFAPYGVRVNSIAPGVQRTPMWDHDVRRGAVDEDRVVEVTPAGRLGEPWEVGRLAVFLASDDAAYVNGACITIDGGLTSVPIEGTIRRPTSVEPAS